MSTKSTTPYAECRSGVTAKARRWRSQTEETRRLYGIGEGNKDADLVGRRCLLAQRLVERGVRFVQVIASSETLVIWAGAFDAKLTYFHAGRFKQLSRTGGQVIRELLA